MTGVVQGVGFRWATREEAERLGLGGWVRNQRDETVSAELEGDEPAVTRMLDWLRHGPPGSQVESVDVRELPPANESTFSIRHV